MLTNRISLIVALIAIATLALFTVSMVTMRQPARIGNSHAGLLSQRQDEWSAGVDAAQVYLEQRNGEQTTGRVQDAQQAYIDQRHGEQTTARVQDAQQAYLDYRHGEQTTGRAQDANQAYIDQRHGEQTAGVNSALAIMNYRQGEWSGN